MSDEVRTERLVLRPMQPQDARALHAILSDPETMRHWSTLPHESLAVTEAWVAKTIASVAAGEADDRVVLRDGVVIGKVGLWKGDEIGVILSRNCWGRGYATEALRAMIERAFSRGMPRIVADIDPRNLASTRLFETLGFRHTGFAKATFQLGEVWADSLYLTLTPEDWSRRAGVSGHGGG
jgi:RimJ/RimL family protein N-acetyltransferase